MRRKDIHRTFVKALSLAPGIDMCNEIVTDSHTPNGLELVLNGPLNIEPRTSLNKRSNNNELKSTPKNIIYDSLEYYK
jgi:hypothetical protein